MMQSVRPAHLVLEDGTVLPGSAVGAEGVAAGEACFTTAMAGYEEAATDPSYVAQVLAFSYPLVGNYGVDATRLESERVQAEGVVMRRARPAWAQWLASQGVVALEDVDTRDLVRRIRDGGVLRCALGEAPVEELYARALAEPPIDGRHLDRTVGTQEFYRLGAGPRITVVDLGTKRSIPRRLADCGLEVVVVPGSWDAEAVLETDPRAVLVSNGPGDPAVLEGPIETVRELLGRVPLFGICLGHQLLGLTFGGATAKMPYGHRGGNHPVKEVETGKVLITAQNHGFAVEGDERTVKGARDLEVTHVNLNDGTIEGLRHRELPVFGVQYHPEAAPGPHDARPLFQEFLSALRGSLR
jgi:carbamoyl-phosphate synthase small subunit